METIMNAADMAYAKVQESSDSMDTTEDEETFYYVAQTE
jgi:hypothetical protein